MAMKRRLTCVLAAAWLGCGNSPENIDGGADVSVDHSVDVSHPDAGDAGDATFDSSSDAPVTDASCQSDAPLVDGAGTLVGESAFPFRSAVMDTLLPVEQGTGNITPSCGVAAVGVLLADTDITAIACGATGQPTGHTILLGIATTEWVSAGGQPKTLTQSLDAGTYTIGNEGVGSDPDFTMIPKGTNAFVQLVDWDDGGVWIGTGGTVTVTAMTPTSMTGTFSTNLQSTDGTYTDAGDLTGTFTAPACP
jgi:hypothetical protein